MRTTRRLVLLFTVVGASLLLASGIALAVTIEGNNNPNTITGTAENDTLVGYGGADTISGLEGSDSISGGDGSDKLFGSDEHQSTTRGASENIAGGRGDDTIVGGYGADDLSGGADDDTILEGPADDASEDSVKGGAGSDKINVASVPAFRDVVVCGDGSDSVEIDAKDSVANDCENVNTVAPTSYSSEVGTQSTEDYPAYIPTVDGIDPAAGDTTPEGAPAEPPPPSGDVSAQSYRWGNFGCWTAPFYRRATLCRVVDPGTLDWVGVGVYDTNPENRWIWYGLWVGWDFVGQARVHELNDPFDWVYRSGIGLPVGIYGRTSCRSACWRWTYAWSYWIIDT
jgi:hypothetical protein